MLGSPQRRSPEDASEVRGELFRHPDREFWDSALALPPYDQLTIPVVPVDASPWSADVVSSLVEPQNLRDGHTIHVHVSETRRQGGFYVRLDRLLAASPRRADVSAPLNRTTHVRATRATRPSTYPRQHPTCILNVF